MDEWAGWVVEWTDLVDDGLPAGGGGVGALGGSSTGAASAGAGAADEQNMQEY